MDAAISPFFDVIHPPLVPPTEDPTIRDLRFDVKVGQIINMNCTSDYSRPAANLSWFLNDIEIQADRTINYSVKKKNSKYGELESRTVGLKFKLNKDHIKRGRVILKCVSSINVQSNQLSDTARVITRYTEVQLPKAFVWFVSFIFFPYSLDLNKIWSNKKISFCKTTSGLLSRDLHSNRFSRGKRTWSLWL
ncbi:hypothetical protein GQR58_010789 [Nymphon striatum]|nr:hypothetical protein GQR58_010789 [Nymphon striatum]